MNRSDIKSMSKQLEQLENYESILAYLKDKGRNHWWMIKTPDKECYISEGKTRSIFLEYIVSEIERLKIELDIKD